MFPKYPRVAGCLVQAQIASGIWAFWNFLSITTPNIEIPSTPESLAWRKTSQELPGWWHRKNTWEWNGSDQTWTSPLCLSNSHTCVKFCPMIFFTLQPGRVHQESRHKSWRVVTLVEEPNSQVGHLIRLTYIWYKCRQSTLEFHVYVKYSSLKIHQLKKYNLCTLTAHNMPFVLFTFCQFSLLSVWPPRPTLPYLSLKGWSWQWTSGHQPSRPVSDVFVCRCKSSQPMKTGTFSIFSNGAGFPSWTFHEQ